MKVENVTFDDVLKNGPEWGNDILRGVIGRELNGHNKRLRELTSVKIREVKNSKVEDLLTYLEYKREGV